MLGASGRPSWRTDGWDWPNRAKSRVVAAGGLEWHVQVIGQGPPVLLLHGTGSASHSWRDVAPLLARTHTVIVPDLPGHGFTAMPPASGLSLPGMAAGLERLLEKLGLAPVAGIGHSAGAAILVEMALAKDSGLRRIVAINGALLPIRNASLFAPMARLLFLNPFVPRVFAMRGSSAAAVSRLIEGTGSRLDARGIELYRRLMSNAGHVEGALGMMANWDLHRLKTDLPRLRIPLCLVTAPADRAVPPSDAAVVMRMVDTARHIDFGKGGHLAHEEFPDEMAALLERLIDEPCTVTNTVCQID